MERLIRWLGSLTRWALLCAALVAILLAVYASLGRFLVPLVAEYRGEVQAKASQALGVPVRIGALQGRWSGLTPTLDGRDVVVGEGERVLHLDQVSVKPDLWSSLLAGEPRLAHLQLRGLRLGLEQDSQGAWAVQGLPRRDEAPLDPAQLLQRLRQLGRVDVLDSQVTLRPWQHDPVTLTYVGIGLQAVGTRQRLDARATLPDGQLVSLSLDGQVTPQAWRQGSVHAYLDLPQSDWARWLPPGLLGPWRAERLQAGGELWLDWAQGQLRQGVVRLKAPQLRGAHGQRRAVTLDDLALSAWFRQHDEGAEVVVDSLAARFDGKPWETRLQARQRIGSVAADESWRVQADRIELGPLTPWLDALAPLPEHLLTVVDALQARGTLRNVRLDIRPKAQGDQRLRFAANLEGVGFDAYHGAPGAGNVSGSVSGDLGQGELRLDSQAFMLHLEPIFAKPWHYQQAKARLTWRLDQQGFTLVAPYIRVEGEEGSVAADFLIRLLFDERREDYMDLRVGLTHGDGRYTAKYLPRVLSPAVDKWLRSAIVKGTVDEGYFQYQGSINHGAPAHARSISLFFKVRDAALDFQPGWPQVQQVDGNVYIEDSGVRIEARQGQLLDTRVSDVRVEIPHVEGAPHSHLYLDGKFRGGLDDGLKILKQAPIGTSELFAGWEGKGPLQGRVKLDIPLASGTQPKVKVDFSTRDAQLRIVPPSLDLSRLSGDFTFDLDKGLSGKAIRLQAFGRPVNAQAFAEGQPGHMQTRIEATGSVGLADLTRWLRFDQALPASGELPYQLRVELGKRNRLGVASSLKGLAIDLPAPFGKAANATVDSTFGMTLDGPQRRFDARYGVLAQLAYAAPAEALDQGRGELLLGNGTPQLPSGQGLRVRGRLERLDLEPWQQQMTHLTGQDSGGSAQQRLQGVNLSIGQLKAFGMELNQALVRVDRGGAGWDLRLDSREVVGNARVPDGKNSPMVVNLRTLRLPAAQPPASQADDAPDPLASFDPRKVPALDLSIDRLYRGDDLYGRWAMQLRPNARGVAINAIDLDLKGLRIAGQGSWEGAPGATSSWYKGRLQGSDLAKVLQAWGFAPTVTSRSFRLDVDGRWPGSPAWVGLERFSGNLDASLRNGQFVEVEGGAQALRIFGLLNFNAIGRRLRLDFSDLFGKGLAYDRVKGLLVASNGVYVTREPIAMTGPSSNVELDGTLDLVRDRVAANLQVALPVTNNLPLAAVLVGAPAVGGALFLVDRLIGDRISRYASVHYRVEGPLKEPRINFVKPFDKSSRERR